MYDTNKKIMEAKHKKILQRNHDFLRRNLDLDSVKTFLFQNEILTGEDLEQLDLPTRAPTEKREYFLTRILPKRGPGAYGKFIEALQQDEHDKYIIDALEATQVSEAELNNGNLPCDDRNEPVSNYDFAIFHSKDSDSDTQELKLFLEQFLPTIPYRTPKIWHCAYDDYGKPEMQSVEYAMKHSSFYIFYIDENFIGDKWSAWIKEQGLTQLIYEDNPRLVVPMIADSKIKKKRIFGLANLKPIELYRITDGISISDFMKNQPLDFSPNAEKDLKLLRSWFERSVLPKYVPSEPSDHGIATQMNNMALT